MEKSEERGFLSYCHRKQKNGTKRISELVNSPLTKYTYSATWNLGHKPVICSTFKKGRSKSNVVHKMKLNWCTVNPSKVWQLLITNCFSEIPILSSQSMHSSWTPVRDHQVLIIWVAQVIISHPVVFAFYQGDYNTVSFRGVIPSIWCAKQ